MESSRPKCSAKLLIVAFLYVTDRVENMSTEFKTLMLARENELSHAPLARIDENWATQIRPIDIWRYNRGNAEEIHLGINLADLGGLVVRFSDDIWLPDEFEENGRLWSQIVLAFDEPARATLTSRLIDAATSQRGEESTLVRQFKNRFSFDQVDHDFDEHWLIPVRALDIVQSAELTSP